MRYIVVLSVTAFSLMDLNTPSRCVSNVIAIDKPAKFAVSGECLIVNRLQGGMCVNVYKRLREDA